MTLKPIFHVLTFAHMMFSSTVPFFCDEHLTFDQPILSCGKGHRQVMLARAEGDVQLLQQKVKDLDVLMGLNGNSMGYPGTPKIFSFFDGRNRDLYGINMMGLIMRTLAPKGVRHSQTKPFTQFSPCMYLFDLNWFIAAVMAGARERQDHTSEGRCRSYSDARKHVGLDQHV